MCPISIYQLVSIAFISVCIPLSLKSLILLLCTPNANLSLTLSPELLTKITNPVPVALVMLHMIQMSLCLFDFVCEN